MVHGLKFLAIAGFWVVMGCEPVDHGVGVTAFVNVTVLPMTAPDAVLRNHTVLVRDGRITAVGPADQVVVPDSADRLDGTGRYLIPGLADMHVHLEYFDDPDVLALFIVNGVTTVRNMDGRPYLLAWRDSTARGELLGPRIFTAGPLLDGDPPILRDNTVVRDGAEAAAAVRAQAAAGYDFIKVYGNLSSEAYGAVLRTAAAEGVPVAGHVPRWVDLADALAGRQASIEHLADLGDLVESDDSPFRDSWHWTKPYLAMPVDRARFPTAAATVAAADVWVVPTLIQSRRALGTSDSVRHWLAAPGARHITADALGFWTGQNERSTARMDADDWATLRQGRANQLGLVGALHAAGVPLLVGTDTPNPFVIPGYSVVEELRAFVAAGLTPGEALMAATHSAARFLGVLEAQGTVEVGRHADLLMLERSPLDDVANVAALAGVMVGGRWLPRMELDDLASSVRVP